MTVERAATGIIGLDDFLQGGFPKDSVILISGGPGTGKTLFCCQYIRHGLENGENSVFITLEEDVDDIKEDARQFGWEFDKYEEEGRLNMLQLNPFQDGVGFTDRVREAIEDVDATRVAIDSLSVLGIHQETAGEIRQSIYDLVKKLKRQDVTTVLTSEIPPGAGNKLSRYGVEEFVVDGVIMVTGVLLGNTSFRSMQIVKMRKTKIDSEILSLNITDKGLQVRPSAV